VNVFLTGGTGFVGSAVLRRLLVNGHEVQALARSDDSAAALADAGATPVRGDITDVTWLTQQLASADGAIHTASPGDAESPSVDRAIATAATEAFAGTGRPYVHTSGIWIYGSGSAITEESPFNAPAITAWRKDVEQIVLAGEDVRAVIVVPAVVYGHGRGIPSMLTQGPRDDSGALALIGDGTQHWPLVHTEDLAVLYTLALDDSSAGGYYLGAGDENVTVRDLGEAAAATVAPQTVEQTRERFGAPFADALLLDQQVTSTKARDELGWKPQAISLLDDIRHGSYAS